MPDIAWPIDSIWRIRSAAVNMSQRASASQSYDGQPSRFIVSKTTGSSPMERIRMSHGLACRLEIEVELDESITLDFGAQNSSTGPGCWDRTVECQRPRLRMAVTFIYDPVHIASVECAVADAENRAWPREYFRDRRYRGCPM
jgi:hypothetical protein